LVEVVLAAVLPEAVAALVVGRPKELIISSHKNKHPLSNYRNEGAFNSMIGLIF
jgi:hypothetical protein